MNVNTLKYPLLAISKCKNLHSLCLVEKVKNNTFFVDKAILNFYDFPFHLQKNLSTEDMELITEKELLQSLEKIKWLA